MKVQITALMTVLLVAGCSHETLDWDNARVDGGKIYNKDANTPFTGNVTNIPDTMIISQQHGISGLIVRGMQGGSQWNNTHTSGTCDGSVKDGYLNGEVTCTDNGVTYLDAHYDNGQASGDFKFGKAGDQPSSHYLLEASLNDQGVASGTQTFYKVDGSKAFEVTYK